MKKKWQLCIIVVFVLVGTNACTGTTSSKQNQPPEEVFWRIAQDSLLTGQRIESLTITRMAECQLSENTKASYGWVSEWIADFEIEISDKNGPHSTEKMTRSVHLETNGAWEKRDNWALATSCTDP